MKLDRNTNRGGRGKYALVNMRKIIPIMDKLSGDRSDDEASVLDSFDHLVACGIITLGNETPGDQFFVMKYKDKFTAPALHAYAIAAQSEAHIAQGETKSYKGPANTDAANDLNEYAQQMFLEAKKAAELGNRIPD